MTTSAVAGAAPSAIDDGDRDQPVGSTRVASLTSGGAPADGFSLAADLSSGGRYVAFSSVATNLAPRDRNGLADVFVRDRRTRTTELVSRTPDGRPPRGRGAGSLAPAISADGRFVAYQSDARGIVPEDRNRRTDVFVLDRTSGVTAMINRAREGGATQRAYGPVISADGRYVAYWRDTRRIPPPLEGRYADVFRYDRQTGRTIKITRAYDGGPAHGYIYDLTMTSNGGLIAFSSSAPDLVPEDTNETRDVFVHDVASGTTVMISRTSSGGPLDGASDGAAISPDGSFVGFVSEATNLVPYDLNGAPDIFLRDIASGAMTMITKALDGSGADGFSGGPDLSTDGRHVVFWSEATNLVGSDGNGSADVFWYDRETGDLHMITNAPGGGGADGQSFAPSVSADGRLVAFQSAAGNLVPDDPNGTDDIFVHRHF